VVVQVRHHLRRDPHGATVVDPLLGVQHGHDQQRDCRAQAVLEVWVAHARIQENLTAFFHPRAVIEIAGIKLLEQELVPGVTTLVNRTHRRSLSLPLGLCLSLAMVSGHDQLGCSNRILDPRLKPTSLLLRRAGESPVPR